MPLRTVVELLFNTGAGTGAAEQAAGHALRRLAGCGMSVNLTELRGDDVEAATRAALRSRPDAVIAAGGDGTLSTVAAVLAGTGIPLAILPLGTRNHFAADLGIPGDADAAIDNVRRGEIRRVDLGRVNGRVFINNSSLGLYPRVVRRRDELRRHRRLSKWAALLRALPFALWRLPLLDVSLTLDGTTVHRRTPLLFVGNNRYELDGPRFGARARLDGGELSVHIIRRTDRRGVLKLALNTALGRLPGDPEFESLHTDRVEVRTRRRQVTVAIDGELERMTSPLVYEIVPRALAVIVPTRPAS